MSTKEAEAGSTKREQPMPASDGFKLAVPHAESCTVRDDARPFVVHDRTLFRGRDRGVNRSPKGGTTWHVFICNDVDCPAEAWVRWDTLADFVSGGLADTVEEERRKPIEHGTVNAYQNRGCRCDACRSAYARYQKERATSRGGWRPGRKTSR